MIKFYTTFLALALAGSAFAQQLPNSGFESWTTSTTNPAAKDPNGYETTNGCFPAGPTTVCNNNVELTTDKHSGTNAAKLTVASVFGTAVNGAITTNINSDPIPFNNFKPTNFSAYVKFAPQGSDVARIRVTLFNGSTEVGSGIILLTNAIASYTKVESDITYSSGLVPDGILVDIVSGDDVNNDPVVGTVLYADDFSLNYGTTATYSSVSPVKISMNTEAGSLTFSEKVEAVSIVNINGTTVQSSGATEALALQGVQAGLYIVRFTYKGQLYAHKMMMQ